MFNAKIQVWRRWHRMYKEPFADSRPRGPMGGGYLVLDNIRFFSAITYAARDGVIVQALYFLRWLYPTFYLPWDVVGEIVIIPLQMNKYASFSNERKGLLNLLEPHNDSIIIPWNTAFSVPESTGIQIREADVAT